MDKTTSCVVYWLHDERCICPWRHGYIGISTRWSNRLKRHRSNRRGAFRWTILFVGSLGDCLNLERQLRPEPSIGWNEAPGGEHGGGSAAKKERTRELMRVAALRRYADPAERERTRTAVKHAFKSIDRSGKANSMYGKHMSEVAKEKIRLKIAERSIAGARNPNYRHGNYLKDKRNVRGQFDFDF